MCRETRRAEGQAAETSRAARAVTTTVVTEDARRVEAAEDQLLRVGGLASGGIPRRPHVRKLIDELAAEAAVAYLAGASLATMGKQFGVSPDTIQKELLRAGDAIRPRQDRE